MKPRFITFRQLQEFYKETGLTTDRLRYFLRRRKINGLCRYVAKPHARLLLIDIAGFEKWLASKIEIDN